MKRRKNVNKYSIGEHGQITNNNPYISKRSKMLFEMLSLGNMVNSGLFTEGESYTGDDVCESEEPVVEVDTTSTDEDEATTNENIDGDNEEDIKDKEE